MSNKYLSGSMKRKVKDKRDQETKKLHGSLDKFTFKTNLSTRAQSPGKYMFNNNMNSYSFIYYG